MFENHRYLDFHTHRQRQQDRDDVAEIISIHPGKEQPADYFTVGLHPWWTTNPVSGSQRKELTNRLTKSNCLAMGEMGLDSLKGPDLAQQIAILKSQLQIANELAKPVVIHCVRAFDPLIQLKKSFHDIPNWCIHGYGRHATLAAQLIHQGFYLSFMPGLPKAKLKDLLQTVPEDRLFLETDSMPKATIFDVYSRAAKLIPMKEAALQQQLIKNAHNFFCL